MMKDLHNLGLRGGLANFITSFLSNRKFWVQIGSTLSNFHNLEEGVSQGNILSVTQFNVKKYLNPGIYDYLFVDDFCITSRSKYMRTV